MVTTDETWYDKYTKIKLERKKHKHTTKENHQTTKKDSKEEEMNPKKNYKDDWKTIDKMSLF